MLKSLISNVFLVVAVLELMERQCEFSIFCFYVLKVVYYYGYNKLCNISLYLTGRVNALFMLFEKLIANLIVGVFKSNLSLNPIYHFSVNFYNGQKVFQHSIQLRTRLLLKPGRGPWTRTLKNLDSEKPGP